MRTTAPTVDSPHSRGTIPSLSPPNELMPTQTKKQKAAAAAAVAAAASPDGTDGNGQGQRQERIDPRKPKAKPSKTFSDDCTGKASKRSNEHAGHYGGVDGRHDGSGDGGATDGNGQDALIRAKIRRSKISRTSPQLHRAQAARMTKEVGLQISPVLMEQVGLTRSANRTNEEQELLELLVNAVRVTTEDFPTLTAPPTGEKVSRVLSNTFPSPFTLTSRTDSCRRFSDPRLILHPAISPPRPTVRHPKSSTGHRRRTSRPVGGPDATERKMLILGTTSLRSLAQCRSTIAWA